MKRDTKYTTKNLRGTKYVRKNKEVVIRMITFMYRTWKNILAVMEKLKTRYKKVTLKYQTAMGADLFSGSIAVQ